MLYGGLADLCDLSYSVAVYVNKRMLLGSIFWGSISGVALIGTIGQGIRWLIIANRRARVAELADAPNK